MDDERPGEVDRARRDGEREAERLRRDQEREAQRARREEEKAAAAAQREAERLRREQARAERDLARAEREVTRAREAAVAEVERLRREAERAALEAAKEASAASREAQRVAAEASRAERRAARQAERAHARARLLESDDEPDGPRLPREVAVLWRREQPVRRGPRPGLTLDDIADAGIAVADADGLEVVSMARVAEQLGYTAMSLYRYVASKDEVVALMVDRAIGTPPVVDPQAGWRDRLEAVARAQRPALVAHPWLTATPALFNALGPRRLGWMEAFVAALDGTPLSGAEKLAVAGALGNQAVADVRTDLVMAEHERSAAERGEVSGFERLTVALVDPASHPALAAVFAEGAGADDEPGAGGVDDEVGYGIRLLVDGVAARIAQAP